MPAGPAPPVTGVNCLNALQGISARLARVVRPCLTPHQYRVAYCIQPLLDQRIDGRGETVTVVSPAPPPHARPSSLPLATDIRQDMAAFDGEFGLPAARIQVVTTLAGAAAPWQATPEEVEDFQIVHTVAPAATLRVILLPANVLDSAANSTADMLAALRLAVNGTDVASISWSVGEHYFTKAQVTQMHSILEAAAADHVTVDASSGDYGASSDPGGGCRTRKSAFRPPIRSCWPPAAPRSPRTSRPAPTSARPPWAGGTGPGGSGGGFSHLYARPAYQDGVPGITTTRGVPDVAGARLGSLIPMVFVVGGKANIIALGGTSASAPLWGGLMTLADQDAHHDLGLVNPAIYRIARSSSYYKAFHDVTTSTNTVTIGSVKVTGYHAAPGWDPVTGWGSPDVQVLVPLLARVNALTSHSKT